MRPLRTALLACATALLAACSEAPAPAAATSTAPAAPLEAPAGFINKVWQVKASSTVAPGTLYAFLSEGTLVITSPGSKPLLGNWKHEGGQFTMIEEGQPYRTEVLKLTAEELQLRSHNPGTPVEITLVPAAP